MARPQFPMPTAGQLRRLAQAAAQNAADLAADARLLLDAERFPRAHALASLALEELGKAELCHDMLARRLDEKSFRQEWSGHGSHLSKLDRSHILAILSAPTADRVLADMEDGYDMRLRGLYVDPNPADPNGPPETPFDVTPALAREMVQTAEGATQAMARLRATAEPPQASSPI